MMSTLGAPRRSSVGTMGASSSHRVWGSKLPRSTPPLTTPTSSALGKASHAVCGSYGRAVSGRGVCLPEIREHGQPSAIEGAPLIRIRQWRNGDGLAPIKADERGVHQLFHLLYGRQCVHVVPRALPDFGARRRRQDRLDIDTFGAEFQMEPLREE